MCVYAPVCADNLSAHTQTGTRAYVWGRGYSVQSSSVLACSTAQAASAKPHKKQEQWDSGFSARGLETAVSRSRIYLSSLEGLFPKSLKRPGRPATYIRNSKTKLAISGLRLTFGGSRCNRPGDWTAPAGDERCDEALVDGPETWVALGVRTEVSEGSDGDVWDHARDPDLSHLGLEVAYHLGADFRVKGPAGFSQFTPRRGSGAPA